MWQKIKLLDYEFIIQHTLPYGHESIGLSLKVSLFEAALWSFGLKLASESANKLKSMQKPPIARTDQSLLTM